MDRRSSHVFLFWWRWLVTVTSAVIIFGAFLVVSPRLARGLFGLLCYGSGDALSGFSVEAVRYIALAHGVLGAVMMGWGVAFLLVLLGPFRQRQAHAWRTLAVSLSIWFIVDSGVSLWTGFWQNALLNTVLALLFLPALLGIRRYCTGTTHEPV